MKALLVALFAIGLGLSAFALASLVTPRPADRITVSCVGAVPGVTYIAHPYGAPAFMFRCLAPSPSVAQ